ncbi:MAG TPA: hypothetical protein VNO31_16390, partial [Umezawaea sp.]|nr:hypothetical protein [Umezawaea sp.]
VTPATVPIDRPGDQVEALSDMSQQQCFRINASNNRRVMIFASGVPLRQRPNRRHRGRQRR